MNSVEERNKQLSDPNSALTLQEENAVRKHLCGHMVKILTYLNAYVGLLMRR